MHVLLQNERFQFSIVRVRILIYINDVIIAFEPSLLDAGDVRWDVSFLPGGRGKGLDNKTRRMFSGCRCLGCSG